MDLSIRFYQFDLDFIQFQDKNNKLFLIRAYHYHIPNTSPKDNSIMAEGGGIDRRADEKMELSTSKEVTVHPTFESMSLKGKAVATILLFLYSHLRSRQLVLTVRFPCRESSTWYLRVRLRIPVRRPISSHRPNLQGT